jgi:hypothetical protein
MGYTKHSAAGSTASWSESYLVHRSLTEHAYANRRRCVTVRRGATQMKKISFVLNHTDFAAWLHQYDSILLTISQSSELESGLQRAEAAEGVFLKCVTRWERLCEKDIIASLNRDSRTYASALGLRLRQHLTRDEAFAMLVGHHYLDFKSAGQLKAFAKQYLSEPVNPFPAISSAQAGLIQRMTTIRNYIAHDSSVAQRAYRRLMGDHYRFSRIPEPGHFLLALYGRPKQHRWREFLYGLRDTSWAMLALVTPAGGP